MRQNLMAALEFNTKHRIGQRLDHAAFDFDSFFLRHTLRFFPSPSGWFDAPSRPAEDLWTLFGYRHRMLKMR